MDNFEKLDSCQILSPPATINGTIQRVRIWHSAAPWILLGLAIAPAGCGQRDSITRLPIKGAVSSSTGQKLHGAITFVPAEGHAGPAATTAIVDGQYQFDTINGPVPGPHRVIVKRIDSSGRIPEPRASSQKTDAKSVTNPAGRVEWTFSCNLKATESGPHDFTIDAE